MSDLRDKLKEEVERILEEALPDPSEPIRLETESVFDPELDSAGYPLPIEGALMDNPLAAMLQPLIQYFEAIKPEISEPIKTEHKVRIFWLHKSMSIEQVREISQSMEALLNEGYCCHMPTVVGDFVIMDFSRRKETKDND